MKAGFWLSVSVAALMSSGVAHAQTAPTTDPTAASAPDAQTGTDTQDGDIVITAERRSTSLQRTPVAASVLNGEDLVRKSISTVEQLQFATPSLTVNTSGQSNSFNIRGIGKTEITSSIGVGVVTYRDGVATFPGYFQTEPYYDIASVEVLRGPQGTFAGGNATGGAVFITEKNPDTKAVNGYMLAQYGNYNDYKFQGAINLPISSTLALRVAGNYEKRDTFFKVTGPWTGNPGNLDSFSTRASLLWEPDSHLRVLIKGDYNNVIYGGFPNTPAYFNRGTAAAPIFVANNSDPFNVTSNAFLTGKDEFGRVSANISYTFDSGLMIRSISAYQNGTTQETLDADGTATGNPVIAPSGNQTFQDFAREHIWSQEFNIVSPDSNRFTWLLGAYVQRDSYRFPPNGGYRSLSDTGTLRSLEIIGTNPHTALAGFGQIGYKLTDSLQVTLGGRWSRTTSRNDATYPATLFVGILVPVTIKQNDFFSSSNVDGKFAINWTIDSNNFAYAFVATGTKAGGLNGSNFFGVTPRAFRPERVTDYEIGYKGTLMNGHLRTQIGGYYNVYKNFQVSIVDPATPNYNSIFNVPNPTKLYGLEASAQGSFGAFQFDFSTSISHSEVGKFFARDPRIGTTGTCDPVNGPGNATCLNLDGRRQTYSPQFTVSVGAQYAIPLGTGVTLTPRVDYAHISSVWATLFQRADLGDYLPQRNIVNAQLTLNTGKWTIGAYSTNLTDQHYISSLNGIRRMAAPPRQYGVRASFSF
ncbi:TonB-dependent receptor [Sphingomonas panacisoli]|nr:TonB-dependent receptor [Sphingomonas panacisoli]